jgi:transcriptional regulator GlxA family with amidase domain
MSYQPAARAFEIASTRFDGVVAGQVLEDEVRAFAPDLKDILARAERSIGGDMDATRALLAKASAMVAEAAQTGDMIQGRAREASLGGLAPWQAKRVSAHIDANLGDTIPVSYLAQLVTLSAGHFSRAFKQTFGDTPHGHVMRRRVESAKAMMLKSAEPLSQIAYLCGFADQAHFSRTFRKLAGATPLAWRRAHYAAA